jgi:hypothetical protein
MPPRRLLEPRGSSLSSRPLQRSQHGEVTMQTPEGPCLRRAFHGPTTTPPRDSHPFGDSTPPRARPACFIRHTLMGLHPSEPSSSTAAVTPLDARSRPDVGFARSCRTVHVPLPWHPDAAGTTLLHEARLHGLAPPPKLPPRSARFRRATKCVALLGFAPLQGDIPDTLVLPSEYLLPRA